MNKIKKEIYVNVESIDNEGYPFLKVKDNRGLMNYINQIDDCNISNLDRLVGKIKPEIEELILNGDSFGDIRNNIAIIRITIGKKEVRLYIDGDAVNEANKGNSNEQ